MTITLDIEVSGNVTARFEGEGSENVTKLFGGNRIPTPFTFSNVNDVEEWAAHIIGHIRSRNPGTSVEWSHERSQQFAAFRYTEACLVECGQRRA